MIALRPCPDEGIDPFDTETIIGKTIKNSVNGQNGGAKNRSVTPIGKRLRISLKKSKSKSKKSKKKKLPTENE